MPEETKSFEGWCVLELMGHRRLGGYLREVQLAGAGFLRIDIPGEKEGDTYATQFYPAAAVYCLTPASEEAAKAVAAQNRPQPVHTWELPHKHLSETVEDDSDEDDYEDENESPY